MSEPPNCRFDKICFGWCSGLKTEGTTPLEPTPIGTRLLILGRVLGLTFTDRIIGRVKFFKFFREDEVELDSPSRSNAVLAAWLEFRPPFRSGHCLQRSRYFGGVASSVSAMMEESYHHRCAEYSSALPLFEPSRIRFITYHVERGPTT